MNNTIFYYPSLEIIYREKLINKNNLLIKFNKHAKKQFQFNQVLSLENVSFSYSKNIIFNNFNYNFYKKSSYAIVGPSGSGKSTLLNILLGISKVKTGFVKIDGKNIEKYLENYLSIIAYIPQEFIFLEGSVKNTISFGGQYDEKKILHLIKDLNVFKEKNIDKIKNLLNQNVKLLSLGQRQKIFIIRALYNNSDIIIFDEPTSALDKNSISELQIILKKIKKTKTLIVVTHDTEFSKNFDYIIDLNKIN
jgi:ATP-binding cassette subfamily C protein